MHRLAVPVDGEYATAFHTARAHRQDRDSEVRNILLPRVADDRIAEVWHHHFDQFAVDEF